jgi:hypothetical protein
MFGFASKADVLALKLEAAGREMHLVRRLKLLEKRLGLTYNEGPKKKAHYKVAGKVGRPKKTEHGKV